MKKVFNILFALATLAISSISYADCPKIETITQTYSHPDNWQAPWYEGFSEGAKLGTKVTAFTKACWFMNHPERPAQGATYCFYKLSNGKELYFVQNNWDITVSRPRTSQWTRGFDEGCDLVCRGSIENCGFKEYPPN